MQASQYHLFVGFNYCHGMRETNSTKQLKMECGIQPSFHSSPLMPQGKTVIEDVQWIVIRLNATMAPSDIAVFTDLSKQKVMDIIHYFAQTEGVKIPVRE